MDLPLISRFFAFRQGGPPPAKLDDDTVVITVAHEGVTKEVEFSRASTAAEIKEAICLRCRIAVGTVIELENDKGRGVTINGHLKPGAYTVTVVP